MADYDSASLSVDTETILVFNQALMAQVTDVVNTLESINSQLSALALGWAGQTAEDVQQINDNWTGIMTQLFGTQDNPNQGVINVMLGGLQQVAVGYSVTEWQLAAVWQQFYNQLSTGTTGQAGDVPSSPPQNIEDTTTTAVTEGYAF